MRLSDELLLDAYKNALKLKLSSDFIEILKKEMDRRNSVFRPQPMYGNEDARTIMDTYTSSFADRPEHRSLKRRNLSK